MNKLSDSILSSQPTKIEVFYPGMARDSMGRAEYYSSSDLQGLVDSYNPDIHIAPFIISHDEKPDPTTLQIIAKLLGISIKDVRNPDKLPSLGWVKDILYEDNRLYANVLLTPIAQKLISAGYWLKVSIALYPKDSPVNPDIQKRYYLRHIALVHIPAMKNMKTFSEEKDLADAVIAFAESIESEVAAAAEPQAEPPAEPQAEPVKPKAKKPADKPAEVSLQDKATEEIKAELVALRKELAEQQKIVARKGASAFVNRAYSEGRLIPADFPETELIDKILESVSPGMQFSEADVDSNPLTWLISRLPAQVNYGEKCMDEPKKDYGEGCSNPNKMTHKSQGYRYNEKSEAMDKKARAYMKEQGCTYVAAMKHVMGMDDGE